MLKEWVLFAFHRIMTSLSWCINCNETSKTTTAPAAVAIGHHENRALRSTASSPEVPSTDAHQSGKRTLPQAEVEMAHTGGRPPKSALTNLDCSDNKTLQSTLNRIQADVHWALRPIFAQGEQLKAHSHLPCATIIREAQAMTNVRQAKPVRNETLETLAV